MAKKRKPNILVLWGDDIGWWNISYNNRGQMGYRTPNIDRVANEGLAFTDYYGQQSCTAGRAAFITGQNPIRPGLTKVGMPGADVGLRREDPTIAGLLKPHGAFGAEERAAMAVGVQFQPVDGQDACGHHREVVARRPFGFEGLGHRAARGQR